MQYNATPGICMGERTKVYPPHAHDQDENRRYYPIKPFKRAIIAIHSLYPKFCIEFFGIPSKILWLLKIIDSELTTRSLPELRIFPYLGIFRYVNLTS